MSIAPGMRLGPYDVVALIGAGGMGEVYRARDTRLNRDVAVKVLPELFAADPDRLARFKREAQVLASLNHPNIAAIYGFEENALVLELVEGPTLADRIAKGPIPLDEALPIARQIAEALEAAHEHGVVHRDLKPANIKVRPDGTVKVLDFGLAKAFEGEAAASGIAASVSPTITSPAATRIGMILGTAAYMSPEQARGKPVDRRSDVWAFGCVVYEMLTGRRAFEGEEVADVFAGILTKAPDWSRLPDSTPPSIHRLLHRTIERDRRTRLADVADARIEIDEAAKPTETGPVPAAPPRRHTRERLAWTIAVLLALACGGILAFVSSRAAVSDAPAFRAAIEPPDDVTFVYPSASPAAFMAVSPDGRRLAFVAADRNGASLWVRQLDGLTARPLTGTAGATYPFWSPDSRFVAFFAGGKLRKADVSGGPSIPLADAVSDGGATSGTWSLDNVILFRPRNAGPLYRVSASGGAATPATTLDDDSREIAHSFPFFLPDDRHFLYSSVTGAAEGAFQRSYYVGSLDSDERKVVLNSGGNVQYGGGYLFFVRDTTLLAQPFDVDRLELAGDPSPVAEEVWAGGGSQSTVPLEAGAFSVSPGGVLVYRSGSSEVLSQLLWLDRTGRQLGALGEQGDYIDLELSPDGMRAAVSVLDPTRRTRDIWLFDVVRGLKTTRLTSDPVSDQAPVWSPDGSRLVFLSARGGPRNEMRQTATNGNGASELIGQGNPRSWSPDGRFIVYNAGGDLWILPVSGDRKPMPLFNAPFNEAFGKVSPDGRWIAYHSSESGRNEIYVSSFPTPTGKVLVSTGGGSYARWRLDGKEIFYLGADNKLMAADVDGRGSDFKIGAVRPLFQTQARFASGHSYDVSADGQRFLVNALLDMGGQAGPNAAGRAPITLVVNWRALLPQ